MTTPLEDYQDLLRLAPLLTHQKVRELLEELKGKDNPFLLLPKLLSQNRSLSTSWDLLIWDPFSFRYQIRGSSEHLLKYLGNGCWDTELGNYLVRGESVVITPGRGKWYGRVTGFWNPAPGYEYLITDDSGKAGVFRREGGSFDKYTELGEGGAFPFTLSDGSKVLIILGIRSCRLIDYQTRGTSIRKPRGYHLGLKWLTGDYFLRDLRETRITSEMFQVSRILRLREERFDTPVYHGPSFYFEPVQEVKKEGDNNSSFQIPLIPGSNAFINVEPGNLVLYWKSESSPLFTELGPVFQFYQHGVHNFHLHPSSLSQEELKGLALKLFPLLPFDLGIEAVRFLEPAL